MQTTPSPPTQSCPLPPPRALIKRHGYRLYFKELLLFFFRFGVCPLCITASIGYGLVRLIRAVAQRLGRRKQVTITRLGIILFLASFSQLYAQTQKIMKVQANQKAPSFQAKDVYGQEVNLAALQGKVVYLSFMRNAGCPVCNFHVHELLTKADSLRQSNTAVVLVYESSRENLLQYVQAETYPFTFIADPTGKLYRLYAVEKSFGKFMGSMFHGLMPKMRKGKKLFSNQIKQDGPMTRIEANFLIDETGTIKAAHYGRYVGDHLKI